MKAFRYFFEKKADLMRKVMERAYGMFPTQIQITAMYGAKGGGSSIFMFLAGAHKIL